MYLYEAHLPVSDTEAARRFYVEIVGLQFAHRDLTRDAVFLWAGADRRSMLGLWGPSTTLGSEFHKCHIAFNVSLDELALKTLGVLLFPLPFIFRIVVFLLYQTTSVHFD